MSKLELKDVTIVYDENQVNKKICKKVNIKLHLFAFLGAILMIIGQFLLAMVLNESMQNLSVIAQGIIIMICSSIMIIGTGRLIGFFIEKILSKRIKAFNFMDYAFRIKSISAGWFNDRILLRVEMKSNVVDKSINKFIHSIENEHIINDTSDRNNPIHITIDITDNNKTVVSVNNI